MEFRYSILHTMLYSISHFYSHIPLSCKVLLSYAHWSFHPLLPTSYLQPAQITYFLHWFYTCIIYRHLKNRQHGSKMNGVFTWNSRPCFSLQYSFILGYTYSINVFRSINISVKVELVKIRTIFELTGGRSIRLPAKIRSTHASSILQFYEFMHLAIAH